MAQTARRFEDFFPCVSGCGAGIYWCLESSAPELQAACLALSGPGLCQVSLLRFGKAGDLGKSAALLPQRCCRPCPAQCGAGSSAQSPAQRAERPATGRKSAAVSNVCAGQVISRVQGDVSNVLYGTIWF